jgi:Pentapeptide repeats (8 copies)
MTGIEFSRRGKLSQMRVRIHRKRPLPWPIRRQAIKHAWTLPLWAFEWFWEWAAYLLSNWSFLEVLEYLGSLSVVIAVVFYFSESGDRLKQKHYQAWQVINTAQGKGGSGGRIEALQELNADGVPLVGVDVSGAFVQGIRLEHARLLRSNFGGVDARDSDFQFADFSDSDLRSANFRRSNLRKVDFRGADLAECDLVGADLSGADLSDASLFDADLRRSDLNGIHWRDIRDITKANVYGVKNAPEGFIGWATQHGAIDQEVSQSNPK